MNNNIFFRRKIASKTHQYGETDGIGLQIYKCNGTYTHVKLQCTRIYTMCHFYPPPPSQFYKNVTTDQKHIH